MIKLWLPPLGHYLVTLWRDDWNDTTCDTGLDQEELHVERETKRKGYKAPSTDGDVLIELIADKVY